MVTILFQKHTINVNVYQFNFQKLLHLDQINRPFLEWIESRLQ